MFQCNNQFVVRSHSRLIFSPMAEGAKQEQPVSDNATDIIAAVAAGKLGVVQAADRLDKWFGKEDLAYNMQINPRLVGFDPANRDQTGGSAADVVDLFADIMSVGWSWDMCAHACCVEVAPGDRKVEAFNQKLCCGSDLAPVPDGSIKFGSLACGHTNAGLRCLQAGSPCSHQCLSVLGKMSLQKVEEKDQMMATAARTGLYWRVYKASIREEYPEALAIIQGARNTRVGAPITEVAGLRQLHAGASAAQRSGLEPDWEVIRRAALRCQPPWASHVDDMIQFVVAKSGGFEGHAISYLAAFYRQFAKSMERKLNCSLFAAFANVPFQYSGQLVFRVG